MAKAGKRLGEEEPVELAVKGERPDFRVVQPGTDAAGNQSFANVGGMWRGRSKAGNDFYTLRIGKLKLLVFPNRAKNAE